MAQLPPRGQNKENHPQLIEDSSSTTDLTLSTEQLACVWPPLGLSGFASPADKSAFDGLGQDQCRKRQRIGWGANTLRLVLAAARTLWFIAHVDRRTGVPLCRYRPWHRVKSGPLDHLEVEEACREAPG